MFISRAKGLRNREFRTKTYGIAGLLGVFLGLLKGHFLYFKNTVSVSVFTWLSRKISVLDTYINFNAWIMKMTVLVPELKAESFNYLILLCDTSVAPKRGIFIYEFGII